MGKGKISLIFSSVSLIALCVYAFWLPAYFDSIGRSSMPLEEKLSKYDEVINSVKDSSKTIDREKVIEAIERVKTYESANDKLVRSAIIIVNRDFILTKPAGVSIKRELSYSLCMKTFYQKKSKASKEGRKG